MAGDEPRAGIVLAKILVPMRLRARTRSRQTAIVALVLGAAMGSGCASSSADKSAPTFSGNFGTGGGTKYFVDGGPATGGQSGGRLNPLCGHDFDCRNPDDPLACKDFSGSGKPVDAGNKGAGGASSSGGSVGTGGVSAAGGSAGSPRDGGTGEARAPRDGSAGGIDAGDAADASHPESGTPVDASPDRTTADHSAPGLDSGAAGTGGSSNSGPPDAQIPPIEDAGRRYSCQVALPANSGTGGSPSAEPFSQCLPAGDRRSGQPCSYSDQCRPGLACVGLPSAGQCWPYCCDPATSCEKAWIAGGGGGSDSGANLYCGVRSLVEGSQKSTLSVPVCVPAERCTLSDPYPCTGSSCQCRDGKACTVEVIQGDGGNSVRGTTVCAVPGKGRSNEPCDPAKPCAAGYFCSESRGMCLKMCSTDTVGAAACAPGRCQHVEGFPDMWGVCVGATPASR